ncbi:MAG: Uma2 family endonuclease, partial [Treponema sp.]|nr:Uma2 family endonuclease [Treponema sp.]
MKNRLMTTGLLLTQTIKTGKAAKAVTNFIYGTAYAMAVPNTVHQAILVELARQIANFLTGKPCRVLPAPYDVRLFYAEGESDDTVLQPDIIVVCDRGKLGKEGCRGAPDFVVEIISPSNTAAEMQRKFKLYRQAGVR